MMRAIDLFFVAVFFAFTLLPSAGQYLGFAPPHNLRGVVKEPENVELSAQSYLGGEFQQAFERRFDSALGFRGEFVRADNELNMRVFRQLGMDARNSMVLGKHDFIFEREYVDAYLRRDLVPSSALEETVQRLAFVQQYLEARGSTLIVLISPSKPLLYPEYLPDWYRSREDVKLPTNYDVFAPLLAKHGINTIDTQAMLRARKGAVPFTYFPCSGTHWNDPAVCESTAALLTAIGRQLDQPTPQLRCEPYVMEDIPRESERDVLSLSNLWFEERLYRPTPYASARLEGPTDGTRPSMLIVGGSFVWGLRGYLTQFKLADVTFYRYYTTQYARGRNKRINRKRIRWERDVFSKQVLVLEVNADVVQHVGWGLLEDAERAIRAAR